jgi:4-hydroxybenzoate polyprenyltransferase
MRSMPTVTPSRNQYIISRRCFFINFAALSAVHKLINTFGVTLEMIKVEHTLFALPFAFLGAFLAAGGLPTGIQVLWILAAMFGARSAAMAFNRLTDHRIDSLNPRTSRRALPMGLVSRQFVVIFIIFSGGVFFLACWKLNPLAFKLSPLALGIIFFYSLTKRFTWTAHIFLGLALACAPLGGWVAVRGSLNPEPLLLGLAVALWIAGGDIIYACMDRDFDSRMGLHSIPEHWGIPTALKIAMGLHVAMAAVLVLAAFVFQLGWIAWVGLGMVFLLLVLEHRLVNPNDLSRANSAFFTVNAIISFTLFTSTAVDLLLRHS